MEYKRRNVERGTPPTPHGPSELLLIKSNGRLLFLKMSELQWVEAERDYLRLHLATGTHFIRDTMNNFQQRLDPSGFLRIHRSAIVNIHEVALQKLSRCGAPYSRRGPPCHSAN